MRPPARGWLGPGPIALAYLLHRAGPRVASAGTPTPHFTTAGPSSPDAFLPCPTPGIWAGWGGWPRQILGSQEVPKLQGRDPVPGWGSGLPPQLTAHGSSRRRWSCPRWCLLWMGRCSGKGRAERSESRMSTRTTSHLTGTLDQQSSAVPLHGNQRAKSTCQERLTKRVLLVMVPTAKFPSGSTLSGPENAVKFWLWLT